MPWTDRKSAKQSRSLVAKTAMTNTYANLTSAAISGRSLHVNFVRASIHGLGSGAATLAVTNSAGTATEIGKEMLNVSDQNVLWGSEDVDTEVITLVNGEYLQGKVDAGLSAIADMTARWLKE